MQKNIFGLIREVSESRLTFTLKRERLATQDLIDGINAGLTNDLLKIRAVEEHIKSTNQRLPIEDFTRIISEISVSDDDLKKQAIIEFANTEFQYLRSLKDEINPEISRISSCEFSNMLKQANIKNDDIKMSLITHFMRCNLIDNITAEEFKDLISHNEISKDLVRKNAPSLIRAIYGTDQISKDLVGENAQSSIPVLIPAIYANNNIKVFRLLIEKYIDNPVNFFYHQEIVLRAICGNINLLRELIDICPEILQINTKTDETPSSYAFDNPECLQLIIENNPDFFSQIVRNENIVFYAVQIEASDALKVMIRYKPDIVEERDSFNNTIIFEALRKIDLKSFKAIIEVNFEVLFQKNSSEDTPVFYAFKHRKDLKFFEEILRLVDRETIKKILQQENKIGEIPICKMMEFYSLNPTENNLKILKSVYKIQFGKQLEDDEIKNLVDFIKNLNYLKVISNNNYSLKTKYIENIFRSFLNDYPFAEQDFEDGNVFIKIVKIYQDILEDKKLAFSFPNQDGKESKFYIHHAGFNNHQSYFIFHVNEQNKLTAISYCDDYLFHNYKKTENSDYINGITTYQSRKDIEFTKNFVTDFLEVHSKGKKIEHFNGLRSSHVTGVRSKYFTVVRSRHFEFDQDAVSHSIPILTNSLRDPSPTRVKSILVQFLARQCCREAISDLDPQYLIPRGEVFEAHKELLDKVTFQSTESFIESAEKIDPVFWRSAHVQKSLDHFLEDIPMVSKEEHLYRLADLFEKKELELIELSEMEPSRSSQHFSSLALRADQIADASGVQPERSPSPDPASQDSQPQGQERSPSPDSPLLRATAVSCFFGLVRAYRGMPK